MILIGKLDWLKENMIKSLKQLGYNIKNTQALRWGMVPMHLITIVALVDMVLFSGFSYWAAMILGYICIMIFGVAGGLHRYVSHRAFTTYRPIKLFILWCAAMSAQGGPIGWSVAHRGLHHAKSDQEGDIHSPKDGLWHSFLGWTFTFKDYDVSFDVFKRFSKDLRQDADFVWFQRHWYKVLWVSILILALIDFRLIFYFWAIPASITLHSFGLTNCFNHIRGLGYVNGDSKDDSRNIPWLFPFVLGECWHNNHHLSMGAASFSRKWWEVDPTHWFIRAIEVKKQ